MSEASPTETPVGIKQLPISKIVEIAKRFEALNPYASDAVPGSILEVKEVSLSPDGTPQPVQLLVISAKRYTFFRTASGGRIEIIEPSEHGLGHLLDPYWGTATRVDPIGNRRWIVEVWEWIVRRRLGLPCEMLNFAHLPAVTRISVSTPHVFVALKSQDWKGCEPDGLQPASFLLSATVARLGHPVGENPERFHLVAPYSSDPAAWLTRPWINTYSGSEYTVTTDPNELNPNCARLKTFGDVVEEFAVHPECKNAALDGSRSDERTIGQLTRRRIRPFTIDLIGKEANRIEDVDSGMVHCWDDVRATFTDPAYDKWTSVIQPLLRDMTAREIAEKAGVTERTARNWRSGKRGNINEAILRK